MRSDKLHNSSGFVGDAGRTILDLPVQTREYLIGLLSGQPMSPNGITAQEWELLLDSLQQNAVFSFLDSRIRGLSPDLRPPETVTSRIRKKALKAHLYAIRREAQLKELIEPLEASGIGVLVVKGLALAYSVYPLPTMRDPGMDIDLLVRPGQYLEARDTLISQGYRPTDYRFELLQGFQFEEVFFPPTNSDYVWVELQWDLHVTTTSRAERVDGFFERAVTLDTPLSSFKTMSNIDTLIQAALHLILTHSQDMKLSWILDVAFLARDLREASEWEELQERSRECEARLSVESALFLANYWTGLQIPEAFADFASWPLPSQEEKSMRLAMAEKSGRPDVMLRLYLTAEPGIVRRCKRLLRLIFPPVEYLRRVYGKSSQAIPLLYITHWKHWTAKAGRISNSATTTPVQVSHGFLRSLPRMLRTVLNSLWR